MRALVSVHDVMPHTLDRVRALTTWFDHLAPEHIALLVVPGRDWQARDIDVLHSLAARGFVLAGHGWHHDVREIRGLYHRLHAAFISRRAAEHLCLDEGEIRTLIDNCFHWFGQQGLPAPDLYVPPAWAMGNIRRRFLRDGPFRYFESTAGFYDGLTGRSITLPLAGYQADNLFRVCSLTCWNALNRMVATDQKPLRISIHPQDGDLRLKGALKSILQEVTEAVDYHSLW